MLRVLIVEDFHGIREAVVQGRIRHQAPIRVAGEARCGRTAISLVQVYQYDVVLLHAALPDLDGFEVLRQIKAKNASLGVLVCSADSADDAVQAYLAGAEGYFPQSREPQDLVTAITDVAAGQPYFPTNILPVAPE